MKSYEKCLKLITYGPCAALIGSLLIGSPQGFAQNAESSPSQPLRLTVAPQTSSRIAMKTLPKAICALHPDGDGDTSRALKLFSDDDGMIRFNVNPRMESEAAAAFAVDCTSDSQSSTFGLELRPHSVPTPDMPAQAKEVRKPKATDVIRPALTKAEALQLSDEELLTSDYPVRPNAKQAPDGYAAWLQAVTKPARRVNSRQVAHPELRASSNWELLTNWSGFELRAPDQLSIYDLVAGEWYVPTVKISDNNLSTSSAFWIGLDGDGLSDLWQAGTEQDIRNYSWSIFSFDVSNYDAWTELLPPQPTESVLPGFNVSPGDLMFSEVWVGNIGQSPSLSGLFGIAFVEDLTQGEYTYVYNCLGIYIGQNCTNINQTVILGEEAEWIIERPCTNCETGSPTYLDLADYGSTFMYDAYALQTNGSWMNYNGSNNQEIWMYNFSTGDLLSVPYVWNNSTIQYYWYNWK